MTIYLAEKGISDIEVVEVEFPHRPELWPEGFLLKLNPAHSLPVLDTGKGALIGQSIAILEYLRELYPSPNMLGETPEEHAQARELVSIFEEATAFFGIWARQGSRLNADEDTPGALWSHGSIEASRLRLAPAMTRVVVAIDPAVTSGEEADETGIIVAGKDHNGHGYVLADISGRYPPIEWARLAITAYRTHRADRIVAEVDNGGDMVGATLRMVDPNVAFTAVRASRGASRTGGGALPAGPRPSHRHLPATRRPDDQFYIGY